MTSCSICKTQADHNYMLHARCAIASLSFCEACSESDMWRNLIDNAIESQEGAMSFCSELEMRNDMKSKLQLAMAGHDWYYDRSDDHRVWTAGNARYREICNLFADLDKLDPQFAKEAWNERAPKGFQFV